VSAFLLLQHGEKMELIETRFSRLAERSVGVVVLAALVTAALMAFLFIFR